MLDLVAAMEACTVREAALRLRAFQVSGPASQPGQRQLVTKKRTVNSPLGFSLTLDRRHFYLARRGIDAATADWFEVGYYGGGGLMSGRIAIPIHDERGRLVAYCGRAIEGDAAPRYRFPAGFQKSHVLFNYHRALETSSNRLIVVEGFFDCMKLHQHGCRKVVALMGSTMSAAQEELIRKHTDRKSLVIVMLDEDHAGKAGRDDIASRLAKFVFVKVHTFEKDGMQPEDLSAEEALALLA